MSKFLSGRIKELLLGVVGRTEDKTVLQTTGTVGIGTTNSVDYTLYVNGSTNIDGGLTVGSASTFIGVATFTSSDVYIDNELYVGVVNIVGGAALGEDITARNLNLSGIATVSGLTDLNGDFNVAGVSTFQDRVIFDSTNSIQIPVGVEGEKDAVGVAVTGQVRFNTTNQQFEGFGVGNNWGSLGGVKDVDGDTEIKAELSAGSDEDALFFYTGGNLSGILSTTSADFNVDVNIDSNLNVSGVFTFTGTTEVKNASFKVTNSNVSGEYLQITQNADSSLNLDKVGVGAFYIKGNNIYLQKEGTNETYAGFEADGRSFLNYDSSTKFETISIGVSVSNGTSDTATIAGPTNLILDPAAVGDNTGIVRIKGDLYVDGTEVKIDSTTINLADLKIGIATNTVTNLLLDGGGIGIGSANIEKTILWNNSNSRMEFNANLYAPNFTTGTLNSTTSTVSGISTNQSTLFAKQLNVSGISTFADLIDANGGINATTAKVEDLTDNRIVIAGVGGELEDDANLTFNGSEFNVGSAITAYAATGIISATKFYGDGSNLVNTGATLNASSDTQRIVLTSLISGTMVNVATDSDLAYDSVNDRLIVSNIDISGISTLGGPVTAGTSEGISGQYLRNVGTGVTWASFPTLRTTQTTNAANGQTTFNFNYNTDFLDVFINGVKLTSSEYTASNGTSVVLSTPAFINDVVELHSYNTTSTGASGSGATNLNGLTDTTISSLADDHLLQYNSSTNVWENVAVTSLPFASVASVGLSTVGLASQVFVGLSTVGLASQAFVGLSTAGLASEAFVGLSTAGLASQALVGVSTVGLLSATGDASNLTGLTGASAATYGDSTTVSQITVDADGRITSITDVAISGGTGGALDKIQEGNTNAEVIDTGIDGRFTINTNGVQRLIVDPTGDVGIGTTTPTSKLEINVGTAISAFDIQGSAGQLFSVTNNLTTGSIFSVNDVSGIASIDVDADGTIQLAPYGTLEKVGIGITNPTSKLHIVGDALVTGVVTATKFVGIITQVKVADESTDTTCFPLFVTAATGNLPPKSGSNLAFNSSTGQLTATKFSGDGSLLTNVSAGATDVVTVADESSDTTCFPLFVTAATGDLSPKSGSNLAFNSSTGQLTATKFSGDGSLLTNLPASDTDVQVTYDISSNSSSAYLFTGPGYSGADDNPDIYLVRGQRYRFINTTGTGHPFRIQSDTSGTAYTDGVSGDQDGTQDFNVQYNAPVRLYYQCTSHPGMNGNIYVVGGAITRVLVADDDTPSGTSQTYTSIPSWATKITVIFDRISTTGGSEILVQLGTSGGVMTSNYESSSQNEAGTTTETSTGGFVIFHSSAGHTLKGSMVIEKVGTASKWIENHLVSLATGPTRKGNGVLTTYSGTIDRVMITTEGGSNTFDGGTFTVYAEA